MAMERTRIAKVDEVTLSRRGEQVVGTLHLTPHHLIFVHIPPTPPSSENQPARPQRPRELWITYPIISQCTFRAAHPASRQPSSVRLRCRDFTFVCFYLSDASKARDVYDSIKAWTCKLGRIEKLYAFTYQPQGAEKEVADAGRGWTVYDPMREWRRMGVGEKGRGESWRISRINTDYGFSPTYPALLPVPSKISDNTLNYAGRYRSRARIPVLTYLHPVNNCSITRCSQPMVGVRQNRSIQDETLLAAIFATTRNDRPLSGFVTPNIEREESGASSAGGLHAEDEVRRTSTEVLEDVVISKLRGDDIEEGAETDEKKPIIYGAQQKNMIVDARPTVNAYAMQAVGKGTENMENYKFATKIYLGIDNIHVMRDSLQKVVDALKDSDLTPLGPSRDQLAKSGWLKHMANMLDGVGLIARQVGLQHSHVLIHCSDGWDRTSQLSSLSQICLDPYYRTLDGFMVLIEKDWLSFGHMFRQRTGFLSSDKWFQIENERIGGRDEEDENKNKGKGDAISGAQKTFENAFLSAKGFFTKQSNDSRESINIESDAENVNDPEVSGGNRVVSGTSKTEKKPLTKVKETAPIFHQFLDATYQLTHQYPTRFEFSERFLRRLLYHVYSCQYGTFLFDNEKERKDYKISDKTHSVWDYFLARKKEFLNPNYDPELNDNVRGKERLIFPRSEETRWWASFFGRTDEEMNGSVKYFLSMSGGDGETDTSSSFVSPSRVSSMPVSRSRTPVLTGVETSEAAVGVASSPQESRTRDSTTSSKSHHARSASQEGSRFVETEMPPIAFVEVPNTTASSTSHENPIIEVPTTCDAQGQHSTPNGIPIRAQRPVSAGQQERLAEALEEAVHTEPGRPSISSSSQQEPKIEDDDDDDDNAVSTAQADDLDPLGIGDVKEHVSTSTARKTAQDRRRAQMEALMQ